jgi:hypothetical protein
VNSQFGLTVKESVWRLRNPCGGALGVMNASSAGSEFARSARPKELIAVAARCDTTNLPQPLSIAAQEETLETRAWRPI